VLLFILTPENSKAEIVQAFDDFNRGKFGEIPVAVVD
jgi:redox-sensitive bicupin YhaK (pirin superfamily)